MSAVLPEVVITLFIFLILMSAPQPPEGGVRKNVYLLFQSFIALRPFITEKIFPGAVSASASAFVLNFPVTTALYLHPSTTGKAIFK